jgi:hypothetical protein
VRANNCSQSKGRGIVSNRRDECFTLLKSIRRIVDETHEAIEGAAIGDSAASAPVQELPRSLREHGVLKTALESIRRAVELANLPPRTRSCGSGRPRRRTKP